MMSWKTSVRKPDSRLLRLHMSVKIIQLCYCSAKAGIDHTQTKGPEYVSRKLYLQKQEVCKVWPLGHCFLTPALEWWFEQAYV